MPKDQCIFCQIIAGKLPSTQVYADQEFVAFPDIHPKAPVHVLLVPRGHLASLNQLEDMVLAGKWLLTARTIAHKLGIGSAYQLKLHVGRGAGQEVDHIHMHLLGGWRGEV